MLTRLYTDFSVAIRLSLRARLLPFTLWLLLALAAAVLMAAQFSGRQPATVGLDIGLSIIRLSLPLLIVLLAQEYFTREFDRRYYLTSLAYPRARAGFVLGRITALFTIVLAVLAVLGGLLAALVTFINSGYAQATPAALDGPYLLTLLFIAIDLLVLTAVATLLALVAVTPSFVLVGTYGFLLIARSYSGIIALLAEEGGLVRDAEQYQSSLSLLRYLLPDLGSLDVRAIALYDKMQMLPADWAARAFESIAYAAAWFALSVWIYQRKRFS